MSKQAFAALLGALSVAAAAAPVRAQLPAITPFSFEARAAVAFPTGELADDDQGNASTGWVLSGSATYHAIPMIGIYAGYSYGQFGLDEVDDIHYTEQGFDAGLRLAVPTPLIPIDPWIRGGLVFHKLSLDGSDDPDIGGETDTGLGFEVGAGLGFGLGPISLNPGVSFVRYDAETEDDDEITISYFKVEIGGRIRL
jgi:outer membrane protein with beta-barrel domain